MAREIPKICEDCGTIYNFLASGYMYTVDGDLNDERWCSECMKTINKARKTLPRKFEYKWVHTDEYTFDTFEAKRLEAEAKKGNEATFRRAYPILTKLFDMGNKNVIRTITVNGFEYMLNYWAKNPEEANIKKRVYWDVLNNKMADIQPTQIGVGLI